MMGATELTKISIQPLSKEEYASLVTVIKGNKESKMLQRISATIQKCSLAILEQRSSPTAMNLWDHLIKHDRFLRVLTHLQENEQLSLPEAAKICICYCNNPKDPKQVNIQQQIISNAAYTALNRVIKDTRNVLFQDFSAQAIESCLQPDKIWPWLAQHVANGDIEQTKHVFRNNPSKLAQTINKEGGNLAHIAALAPHTSLEMITLLKNKGVDLDAIDLQKYSPLHIAIFFGHLTAVAALLVCGADCNSKKTVLSPYEYMLFSDDLFKDSTAVKTCHELCIQYGGRFDLPEVVQYIIEYGEPHHLQRLQELEKELDLSLIRIKNGNFTLSVIQVAARANKLPMLRFLVEECHVSINHRFDKSGTALAISMKSTDLKMFVYLLQKRANIMAKVNEIPFLHSICQLPEKECSKFLIFFELIIEHSLPALEKVVNKRGLCFQDLFKNVSEEVSCFMTNPSKRKKKIELADCHVPNKMMEKVAKHISEVHDTIQRRYTLLQLTIMAGNMQLTELLLQRCATIDKAVVPSVYKLALDFHPTVLPVLARADCPVTREHILSLSGMNLNKRELLIKHLPALRERAQMLLTQSTIECIFEHVCYAYLFRQIDPSLAHNLVMQFNRTMQGHFDINQDHPSSLLDCLIELRLFFNMEQHIFLFREFLSEDFPPKFKEGFLPYLRQLYQYMHEEMKQMLAEIDGDSKECPPPSIQISPLPERYSAYSYLVDEMGLKPDQAKAWIKSVRKPDEVEDTSAEETSEVVGSASVESLSTTWLNGHLRDDDERIFFIEGSNTDEPYILVDRELETLKDYLEHPACSVLLFKRSRFAISPCNIKVLIGDFPVALTINGETYDSKFSYELHSNIAARILCICLPGGRKGTKLLIPCLFLPDGLHHRSIDLPTHLTLTIAPSPPDL